MMARGINLIAAVVAIWAISITPSALSFSPPRPALATRPIAAAVRDPRPPSLSATSDGGDAPPPKGDGDDDADVEPPKVEAAAAEAAADAPQSVPNAPPIAKKPRLDPLIASLTRMDPETASAKTVRAPLFGEIPLDGSVVVLAPAAIIAVLGFVLSINIAINSKDDILAQVQETTTVMSTPPVMKTAPAKDGECRGICSTQEKDLENLRGFMGMFAKD